MIKVTFNADGRSKCKDMEADLVRACEKSSMKDIRFWAIIWAINKFPMKKGTPYDISISYDSKRYGRRELTAKGCY